MILIVGGEGAGKRSFAATLGYRTEEMADGAFDERPVIFHVERMIFSAMAADMEGYDADAMYEKLKTKKVVICNEVGSGVIPIERSERLGREAVGRMCTRLAREADAVVRIVAGIPQVIKGQL